MTKPSLGDRILAAAKAHPQATRTELAVIVGGRRQIALGTIQALIDAQRLKAPPARSAAQIAKPIAFAPPKAELKRWQRDLNQAELLERLHKALAADLRAEGRSRSRGRKGHGTVRRGRYLLELAPVDVHVGKYAWDDETGSSYDVEIAERVFTRAIDDIMGRAYVTPGIEGSLLVAGNDLLQTDNLAGTTTAGTYVDTDTRYIRSFRRAFRMQRWAIDRLADRGPVRVVVVPGNHDRLTAFQLGHSLEAFYHDDPRVTIDNRPKTRKYHLYGATLLGWTHGDKEKHADLPTIMAVEEPELWAQSRHRIWHLGHEHKKKELRFRAGDTFNGVRVQVLSALCSPDAWHYENGYVGGVPAAEGFLWDRETGPAGSFESPVLPPDRSSPASSRKSAA